MKDMNAAQVAKRILPGATYELLVRKKKQLERARVARLPLLSEAKFAEILGGELGLTRGDVVFIHSSIDKLNLDFPFYRVLNILRDVVGPRGTLVFPTYPNHKISSYEYLLQGNTFDVRKTPSYVGLLTEFARRQPGAVRSLHPTKSVVAIGPHARDLTSSHQNSPYPYDVGSPYYKLMEFSGKIVGLGVWTSRFSFPYCVHDALKEKFPVRIYHDRIFSVPCVNYAGKIETVATYAHNLQKINSHDGPSFMKKYVPSQVCSDLNVSGMKFFRAEAAGLFELMVELAKKGITVYPRRAYAEEFRGRFS
jgi:aminoglycoside 3-N-acetyltransferase